MRTRKYAIAWLALVVSTPALVAQQAPKTGGKFRWYVTVDAETGKTRVVDTLHDEYKPILKLFEMNLRTGVTKSGKTTQ